MAFNDIIDTSLPQGSDDPAEADDNMQRIQGGFQELLDVDHLFEKTGTEISGADSGEHRKITLRTLSAAVVAALTATKAYLYRLVTDGELYFKDASDNTIKLTVGGILNSLNLTGAQTAAGVKTFSSSPIVPAPTTNLQAVTKKYVDDTVGHDGDGYILRDVAGTPTKVYVKYLTGTLDSDSSTSVAHGVTAANILHVSVIAYDNSDGVYLAQELFFGSSSTRTFWVKYDATNIVIDGVGSSLRGQVYRIKIDYTV